MNVLCIGNSFSQDATRYLWGIAHAGGKSVRVVNLYIGGCSLERHFRNLHSGERAYTLEINGQSSGFFVSLQEALLNRPWDVVTLQQVSGQSFHYDSYQPYLEALSAEVRRLCPKAKQVIHQTWAYEEGSKVLQERTSFSHSEEMLCAVKAAYAKAAEAIRADGVLPSGELIGELCKLGVGPLHRDGYHLSMDLGRYAVGLLWYGVLFGTSVVENSFFPWDGEASDEAVARIRQTVEEFLKQRSEE